MKSLITFLFTIQFALAQTKTDCNTIYICIDSISYEQLFSNAYVRDTLFFCQESTTKTLEEEYTGKYAIGKAANLEFFRPNLNDKIGNHLHDFGIEFKTRSLGMLNNLIATAQNKGIAFDTNTTHLNEEDAKMIWYKTLNLASIKTNYEISVLEYQNEFLQYLGFSGDDLSREMTYEAFISKLSNGRKYPRQFNKIKSVTVTMDKSKWSEFRAFCALNGLHQKSKYSYANDELEMNFELNKKQNQARIKKISINLIEAQRNRIIEVSDKINIKVSGKICEILFL